MPADVKEVFFKMGKNSLKKVLLRKIPVQLATEATISQARRHEKASYYIKAAVRMINHKRILILQLYSRKDSMPKDKRTED